MIINTITTMKGSIANVWNKLTNFERYSEWNRFMTRIEGEKKVGAILSVDITPPGDKKMTFTPVLTKFVESKEMRWVGILGFSWLFRGEHYFKLDSIDAHTTCLTHGEIFTGLLVPLFSWLAGEKTLAGFNLMNANLNTVLEAESAISLLDTLSNSGTTTAKNQNRDVSHSTTIDQMESTIAVNSDAETCPFLAHNSARREDGLLHEKKAKTKFRLETT